MSNLPAVQEKTNQVRSVLEKMKPQFKNALPKHVTPERLLRVTMTAIQNNPKLLECDRTSLFSAIMSCAQLGLVPDGILGQAYMIPFKVRGQMRCQFIPGYKGLLTLARNSGEVQSIQAQAVHENDEFEFRFGLDEKLEHIPAQGERGEITHFWACARFKDGGSHWDVMSRTEVESIRDGSQGYQAAVRFAKNGKVNSPWVDHFSEMGRKTVIRRIAKYLPMDVQKAAHIAQSYETGEHSYIDTHGEVVVEAAIEHEEEAVQVEDKSALDTFADDEEKEVVEFEPFDADEPKLNAAKAAAEKGEKSLNEWVGKNKDNLPDGWLEHYEPELMKLAS
ncbi:recombinase RecT [Kiloniella litopenaei]|uniref:recombinase RecT n=1 Tax=Kiloniella litopenaei TaxID=1549748 RepID=UPI000697C4D3|nr:recombinase RecT [Kiloniella litopenaei]